MVVEPIDYPDRWAATEFTCNCGTRCRVDVEFSRWAEVMTSYRHCGKDTGRYFPERIIATLEDRDGTWIRI
jgi:hypothetical protein